MVCILGSHSFTSLHTLRGSSVPSLKRSSRLDWLHSNRLMDWFYDCGLMIRFWLCSVFVIIPVLPYVVLRVDAIVLWYIYWLTSYVLPGAPLFFILACSHMCPFSHHHPVKQSCLFSCIIPPLPFLSHVCTHPLSPSLSPSSLLPEPGALNMMQCDPLTGCSLYNM
jgi:hypothetical protein